MNAEAVWATGELRSVFGGHDQVTTPWPRAPRRKNMPAFDRALVQAVLAAPVDLVEVDPRHLWSSQPWILRHHVRYYLSGQWERTGVTSADPLAELNRFPVVVEDHRRRAVIVSGHHRATAALIEGRPLLVRRAGTSDAAAITPLLWWRPDTRVEDVDVVARRVDQGVQSSVATLEHAESVLTALGATACDSLRIVDAARARNGGSPDGGAGDRASS